MDIYQAVTEHVIKHGAIALLRTLGKAATAKASYQSGCGVIDQLNDQHHQRSADGIAAAIQAIDDGDADAADWFRSVAD